MPEPMRGGNILFELPGRIEVAMGISTRYQKVGDPSMLTEA